MLAPDEAALILYYINEQRARLDRLQQLVLELTESSPGGSVDGSSLKESGESDANDDVQDGLSVRTIQDH